MNKLDSSERLENIVRLINEKPSLMMLYTKFYRRFALSLNNCPLTGDIVEIGSGAGFLKRIIPEVITTDIISYSTVDACVDATRMPFKDGSLRAIFMLNTLHHISDASLLFKEASRCLRNGGRMFIIDQYPGWISYWIYNFLHHEPFNLSAKKWAFETSGPLSGANGALCWIIFYRDRKIFEHLFPELHIESLTPHSPLSYWLAGGLKSWNLLPKSFFNSISKFDDAISTIMPFLSSFVDVELVRIS